MYSMYIITTIFTEHISSLDANPIQLLKKFPAFLWKLITGLYSELDEPVYIYKV